jgi:hypothetical protein
MNYKDQNYYAGRSAAILTLGITFLFTLGVAFGQSVPAAQPKLPDWSGAWSMVGGTVFDRATQTGQGGSVTPGVREHPPYNAEWEAIYSKNVALRDQGRFPDVFTNCGVPAGYPRMFNLPDPYEFVVRPEQVWILAENGPNVMSLHRRA